MIFELKTEDFILRSRWKRKKNTPISLVENLPMHTRKNEYFIFQYRGLCIDCGLLTSKGRQFQWPNHISLTRIHGFYHIFRSKMSYLFRCQARKEIWWVVFCRWSETACMQNCHAHKIRQALLVSGPFQLVKNYYILFNTSWFSASSKNNARNLIWKQVNIESKVISKF